MKILTYNINGIRASAKRGLIEWLNKNNFDVVCIQEVRSSEAIAREILLGENAQKTLFLDEKPILKNYYSTFNCGTVPGYAGTLTLSRAKPDKVIFNMEKFWSDAEGRTTTTIFGKLAIVNAYIPNGNSGRLDFKMDYIAALNKFVKKLEQTYSVVCVGDFNIAHNEIDLTNPRECQNKSVFLPTERKAFGELLNVPLIDTFRHLNPTTVKYSWRSYRSVYDNSYNAWKYRIDYILTSPDLTPKLAFADVLEQPYSDHLPCVLELS